MTMYRLMLATVGMCLVVSLIYLIDQPIEQTLSPQFHEPTMVEYQRP